MLLSTVASFGSAASTADPKATTSAVRCQDLALPTLHYVQPPGPARPSLDGAQRRRGDHGPGPCPGPGRGADSPSWGTGQRPVSCGANVVACRASVGQPRREAASFDLGMTMLDLGMTMLDLGMTMLDLGM